MNNKIEKIYYKNNIIKSEVPYLNGRKNGRAKYFSIKGILTCEVDYCDDKKHGYVRTYYEDGCIESEETYINGIRNNDLVIYSNNGIVFYSSSSKYNYEMEFENFLTRKL